MDYSPLKCSQFWNGLIFDHSKPVDDKNGIIAFHFWQLTACSFKLKIITVFQNLAIEIVQFRLVGYRNLNIIISSTKFPIKKSVKEVSELLVEL